MDRAERALVRIDRAIERGAMEQGRHQGGERDEQLRDKVRDALAELDMIIKEAGAHG